MVRRIVTFENTKSSGGFEQYALSICKELSAPFGRPVLTVPDEFFSFGGQQLYSGLRALVDEFLIAQNFEEVSINPASFTHNLMPYVLHKAAVCGSFNAIKRNDGGDKVQVRTSVVVPGPLNRDKSSYICNFNGKSISNPVHLDFDPDREISQFFALWHEYGHNIDSREVVADRIAACVSRQAFEDHVSLPYLRFWSDKRAAESILGFANPDVLHKYGWPLVEALDETIEIPEARIDRMPWDVIQKVGRMPYEQNADAVFHSGFAINDFVQRYDGDEELDFYAAYYHAACDVLDEGLAPEGTQEHKVIQRFALAAYRLSCGDDAYKGSEPVRSLAM